MNKRARGLNDDPLSTASAGLVALGIDRARRVDVLDVLAFLLDHADASGDVVLDRALFEGEEAVGVDKCLDAYTLLEQLDVVTRTDSGWHIPEYKHHRGPAGETEASLAVLRKHLATIGAETTTNEEVVEAARELTPLVEAVTAPVVPLKRWRRAVPVAAGIAASAAVIAGAAQFVPQAAVTGRNVALSSDSPTTIIHRAETPTTGSGSSSSLPTASSVLSPGTSAVAATATTAAAAPELTCLVPQVLTAITGIDVVRLPLAGKGGTTAWAAVVKGTATLTNTDTSLLLPALNVVVHLANGDTEPVQATLASLVLAPDKAAPFNAVVVLGDTKPVEAVTATATAPGFKSC